MRYTGFSPRAELVGRFLEVRPEDVVLEIGPGSGNTARAVIGRTAGYWGIDISEKAVQGLRDAYGAREDVVFTVADACGDGTLGRTFDRIFSMDTLEHVADARAFFRFAARHLVSGGTALVGFPNGMPEKKGDMRHGISWFETRGELEKAVRAAGFEIEDLLEIRDSAWQKFVRALLWEGPRTIALGIMQVMRMVRQSSDPGDASGREKTGLDVRRSSSERDTYEGTESFRINARGGIVRDAAAVWARFAERAARLFPPYKAFPVENDIGGRRILLRLRKIGPECLPPDDV